MNISASAVRRLPPQSTPFMGRWDELSRIAELLADSACHLITIVGPGGIGKTRLALETAANIQNNYPDGVYFVPLQSIASSDLIVTAVSEAIGLQFSPSIDVKEDLFQYLTQKTILLVLDNFEHLMDGVTTISELLARESGVKLLLTSRERLNMQEEYVFEVGGLTFPTDNIGTRLEDYSAVQLFAHHARRMNSNFSLMDEAEAVVRICSLVMGMPLALELAASWVRVLSCAQLAEEIQRSLDILETPTRNVVARHRTMRAAFEPTWTRLPEIEWDVFMKLSVFRGGFTREAAEAVGGASLRILLALVDRSLLRRDPSGRFDIHELLRQYGEEHLIATGQLSAACAAHSAYFMDFLAQRDEDIKGRRQQAALRETKLDFENIRASWMWAVEQRRYTAIASALDTLVNAADMNYNLLNTQTILQQTLAELAPSSDSPPHPVWDQAAVRLEVVNSLLDAPINVGQLEAILERTRQHRTDHEIAYCLWLLGEMAYASGDFLAQFTRFEECLKLRLRVGDPFYIAQSLYRMSSAYIARGEIERGLDCLRESIRIRRKLGDKTNLLYTLAILANRLALLGFTAEVGVPLAEALAIQQEIGLMPAHGLIQIVKARSAFWRGEFDSASREAESGLDFTGERHYKYTTHGLRAVQSYLASIKGDYPHGYDLCQQYRSDVGALAAAMIEWGLVLALCGLGNDEAAQRALQNTLRIASGDHRLPVFQQLCLPFAAILAARAGNPRRAVELLGLVNTLPPELTGWMDQWALLTQLRTALELELGFDTYTAAWNRGARSNFASATLDLMDNPDKTPYRVVPNDKLRLDGSLSDRELEILRCVTEGLSNREIAVRLFLSPVTVKWHLSEIYSKLGVHGRMQAVARARALKLLP